MKYDLYADKTIFIGQVEAIGEKSAKQIGRHIAASKNIKGRIIAVQVLQYDPELCARIVKEIAARRA